MAVGNGPVPQRDDASLRGSDWGVEEENESGDQGRREDTREGINLKPDRVSRDGVMGGARTRKKLGTAVY